MKANEQITGQGEPTLAIKAAIGERYRDLKSGKRWYMTVNGWEPASAVIFEVRRPQKGRWIAAASIKKQTLEAWIVETLDDAAKKLLAK